jgi:hypothetical protein
MDPPHIEPTAREYVWVVTLLSLCLRKDTAECIVAIVLFTKENTGYTKYSNHLNHAPHGVLDSSSQYAGVQLRKLYLKCEELVFHLLCKKAIIPRPAI